MCEKGGRGSSVRSILVRIRLTVGWTMLRGAGSFDRRQPTWCPEPAMDYIYLTHLWKLLKGLAHQAIWKSRESQSPEAKLSHLVVLFSPHCEHYVQYNHLGRRLEECHWRVHLKSCFWNSVSQFKSCILSYWTKGAVSVWWKIWSCKTQNFLNTVSKRKTKKSQVPVLERRSGKSWTCQAPKNTIKSADMALKCWYMNMLRVQ